MIPSEQALKYLASKKTPLVTKKQIAKFSKKYEILGLMVTALDEKYVNNYYRTNEFAPDFKKQFGNDPLFNPWTTAEGKKLSNLIFGKNQSPFIGQVWEMLDGLPYQRNWSRRSFRAKPNNQHIENKFYYLQYIYKEGKEGRSGFTPLELAEYDAYNYSHGNCYLFAAMLTDKKIGAQLHEKIKDILYGEDEIGGVTRNLVKGFLISEDPKNWAVVEKLLLAAQRQEGLRQTILEALDETSVGALDHFIKVILRENLFRFSSVVRAIDTWFGFGWDAPKTSTLKRVLNFAISFFENKSLVNKSLKSKDNLEVYVALWFLGLTDVDDANLKATAILETGVKEKKILALTFMSETGRSNKRITKWLESEIGKDVECDYLALSCRPNGMKINQHIYDNLKKYGDTIPREGKRFGGKIFAWLSYHIEPAFFYKIMINHADRKQIEILAQDISQVPSEQRFNLINIIFPGYFQNSYSYHTKENAPKLEFKKEPWKRSALYQLIQDRSYGVVQKGLALLKFMDLEKEDFEFMTTMLARKNKDLRENLIKLILKQKDKDISSTVSILLNSKKIDQRLAGLEILTILNDEGRLIKYVDAEVAAYKERKKFSKNESIFLEKFEVGSSKFSYGNGFGIVNYSELQPLMVQLRSLNQKLKNQLRLR